MHFEIQLIITLKYLQTIKNLTMKLTNYLKTKLGRSLHLLTGLSSSMILLSTAQLSAQSSLDIIKSESHIGGYNIKCNSQNTGTLEAKPDFGTEPYTFLWNTGETTAKIQDKPSGIYFVKVTDVNNVMKIDTFELKQPSVFSFESKMSDFNGYQVSTHGNNNGKVEIVANGGTPPYEYLWSNGENTSVRSGLSAGTYSFVISDANQCTTNGSITITEPSAVQVSFTNVQGTSCFEGNDGKATININGGLGDFSVMWKNGSFSLSPDDLSGGYNSVRIFEQGKAILDTGIEIPEPPAIESQLVLSQYNGFNVSCADCFNGSIQTTVTGGTAPYSYHWSDVSNSNTANLNNLNGGEYRLLITDAHGCEAKNSAFLSMPSPKDWSRTGNANIDATEFIGSTDASDVVFKSNNQEGLRLAGNGNVGVGNNSPTEKLDINGNLKVSGGVKIGSEATIKSVTGNGTMGGISFENIPFIGNLQPDMPTCIPNWANERYNYFNGYLTLRNQNYPSRPALYMGSDGESGVIESTREISGNTMMHLKLNSFCGNDVLVGNASSGNLIANYHFGIGTEAPVEKFHLMNGNMLVENASDSQNPIFFTDYINKNVGIGTGLPRGKFEIKSNQTDILTFGAMRTEQSGWSTSYMAFNAFRSDGGVWETTTDNAHGGASVIYSNPLGDLMFSTLDGNSAPYGVFTGDQGIKAGTRMTISGDGRVGIGIHPNAHYDLLNYKLVVDGSVKCKKLRVDLQNWGDYVFDSNYELMDLAGIENYIAENKHLPGMPSASEVENEGVDLGEIVKLQQVKIEELTLLMIQMQKQIESNAKNK